MALSLPHALPRMIERGRTATLSAPIRDGASVAVPTGGTYTLYDDGGGVISTGSVSVVDGVATYALPAADTEGQTLGDAWMEEWELQVPDYSPDPVFRREAALVRRLLYPVISAGDLEGVHPGISAYAPRDVGTWQPQVDEAWAQLQGRIIGQGNRPSLVIGSHALRSVHLYWTLYLVAGVLADQEASHFIDVRDEAATRIETEWDKLSFRYDGDEDGVADEQRQAAEPPVMLTSFRRGGDYPWTSL